MVPPTADVTPSRSSLRSQTTIFYLTSPEGHRDLARHPGLDCPPDYEPGSHPGPARGEIPSLDLMRATEPVGFLTPRACHPPSSPKPSNAPTHPSGHVGARTCASGHMRLPPGSGPHVPRLPRSPPRDGRTPQPPSPGSWSGTHAARPSPSDRAASCAAGCHGENFRPHGLTRISHQVAGGMTKGSFSFRPLIGSMIRACK